MRDAFFAELLNLYRSDRRVIFLTADLGFKLFDPLVDEDPARVINVGIREAGMLGFAAGLAKTGMLPFVYSIAPFITLRCLEQAKLDLCYNEARVVLVGVGGGYAYGPNGPTHHGTDDVGVLSCLPNLRIWTPADPAEVRACVRAAPKLDGPAYLRLGRNGEPPIRADEEGSPSIDGPLVLREGGDATLVTYGPILDEAIKAADVLAQRGIRMRVVHLPTLRPFPSEALGAHLTNGAPVLTIEEHIAIGGLGQEVGAMMARGGMANGLRALSVPLAFPDACLSRPAALAWAGIDAGAIVLGAEELVRKCRTTPGS